MENNELENEIRVFGPPGTGKTTWVSGSVRATAKLRATSRIMVASFTRTAATEIAGRGLPLEREQIGTLHALAYRSIGRPAVAQEHMKEWNSEFPSMALSGGRRNIEDESPQPEGGDSPGDEVMSQVEVLRARMIPEELWPSARARYFNKKWSEWKKSNGVVDFTDMISDALEYGEAPGNPVVGYFDEVQDFTPLELALVRHWGKNMDKVVLAGDDDQCIYSFKGASPDAFLDPPLPESQKRLLDKSYRLPKAVHASSQQWVERLTRREPKDYHPRDEEGLVRTAPTLYWRDGETVARQITKLADEGRSVMVLATCSYMLDRVKHALRAEGIPFHNPYRRSRGDWNPLQGGRGISAAEKVLSYMVLDERLFPGRSRSWTGPDIQAWSSLIRHRGILQRGAAKMIAALPDRELTYDEVAALFLNEEDLEQAVEPSLPWLRSKLLASSGFANYPITVAEKRGPDALESLPRVTIGTIHSVKGGEADVVLLFPDLSLAGSRSWEQPGIARDSVIRQMYVGMTRAREELWVCQPSSPLSVDPHLLTGRIRG